ncbi:MAG: EAL domain-containing protein [Eubacterium sp.]|nr:EAL domain-containing protein [Eubacterium sp.]
MLNREEYHTFYDRLDIGICIVTADESESILFANRGVFHLYQCPDEESFFNLTRGTFSGMKAADSDVPSLSVIIGQIQESSSFFYSYRTQDGHFRKAEAFIRRSSIDGAPVYFMEILSPERVSHVLKSDGLTGLLGQKDFFNAALALSEKNRQTHTISAYCPVYFNITNFREYNRNNGIHAGDRLLRLVADTLIDTFPGQLLGHMAADSFVALVKREGVTDNAETVCKKINSYIDNNNILLKCGIVYADEDADITWIRHSFDMAKTACTSIQNDVTKIIAIYTKDMGERLDNRMYVIQHIDEALEKGYIQAYYQPVVRTLSGRLCGFEALARWEDPEKGLLRPDIFIPILEDARLIGRLDASIIEQVGRMLHDRLVNDLPLVPVSVNLSKLDFDLMDPLQVLEDTVKKHGVPREYFHVEITESVMVWNRQSLQKIIYDFHQAGYEVWLDDFGSEYSSLNILHNYSFDELKIDMGFFRNFDEKGRKIITSVVSMAKSLHMHTLAEGVETAEQFRFLKNIGCGKIQGFYFGRPLPFFEALITCRGKNLVMETPYDRDIFNAADLVDTTSESPVAIVECTNDNLRLLTANAAYLQALASIGTDSLPEANQNLALPSYSMKSRFRSFMTKVYYGTTDSMTYVDMGQYLRVHAEKIAGQKEYWLARAALTNISPVEEMSQVQKQDALLRNLVLLYDGLCYLNMKDNEIKVLECAYLGISAGKVYSDIRASFHKYAQRFVHEDDQERFLNFISPDHIYLLAERSGRSEATDLFRFRRTDGSWHWSVVHALVLLKTRSKDILIAEREDIWERQQNRSWLLPLFLKSFGISEKSANAFDAAPKERDALLFYESNANDAIMAGLKEKNPIDGIQKSIARIGDSLEAERMMIFETRPNGDAFCTFAWNRGDLKPLDIQKLQISAENLLPLYEIFRRKQVARIQDFAFFQRNNPEFRIPISGVRNLVCGQLRMPDRPIGFTMVINSSEHTFQTASQVLSTLTSFLSVLIRNRDMILKFEAQSLRDPLTGVLNRRGLLEFLSRYKGTGYLSFISGDINNLKRTNDTCGHHAGDMLIRAAAEVMTCYSDEEHTFRMGGDEFLMICEDMNEEETQSFLRQLKGVMRASGIDMAFGCYVHQGKVVNPDTLIGRADAEMYKDKAECHKGRDAAGMEMRHGSVSF